MTGKRSVAAVLAAAAVVVAGCGGGDEGLGQRELADRADAICKRYSERARQLPNPPVSDASKAGDYFRAAQALAQDQQDELRELEPGDAAREEFERLLDVNQEATDLLGEIAGAVGDQQRVADLAQDLPGASEAINVAANDLGASDCAGP